MLKCTDMQNVQTYSKNVLPPCASICAFREEIYIIGYYCSNNNKHTGVRKLKDDMMVRVQETNIERAGCVVVSFQDRIYVLGNYKKDKSIEMYDGNCWVILEQKLKYGICNDNTFAVIGSKIYEALRLCDIEAYGIRIGSLMVQTIDIS